MFACVPVVLTIMRRLLSTSKYFAVVLSSLLAVAFGSALQSAHNLHPDKSGAKVHCWSEAYVFDFVLPASEVAKHFPRECQNPLSCNTTCVAKVASREGCVRLKSGCTDTTKHVLSKTQLGRAQNATKMQASFEKNVERRLGELDAKVSQLLKESSYHTDKLVKLSNNLNHLCDARKGQLSAASVKSLDSLDHMAAEMKALFIKNSKSMITAISSVLSLIKGDSKTHLWTIKGYAALKARAIKDGSSSKMCDIVYLRRYLISWGIDFSKSPSGVNLYFAIQVHRGISDEFLEWPFLHELKVSIIHPESGKKEERHVRPYAYNKDVIKRHFSRPTLLNNARVSFGDIRFESGHLERNGYVKTDQLLLKLEMLS